MDSALAQKGPTAYFEFTFLFLYIAHTSMSVPPWEVIVKVL